MAAKLIYAGLGSNLGDRVQNIRGALELLQEGGRVRVLRQSAIVETRPLGGMDQPDYLNTVAEMETSLNSSALIALFLDVEQRMGRRRSGKWSPRPIDIDLLVCGDEVIDTPDVCVPHLQMHLRSFVMRGMKELVPALVHPVLRQPMAVLANRLAGRDFAMDSSRPQLVSIAGMIGVGKTTLAEGLAAELDCTVIREAYDTNPFLARVYAGEKGLALDSQIYFLTSRAEQLGRGKLAAGKPAVSDYAFEQEKVFARKWLDPMQLDLYMKVNACMAERICDPVVTVFIHDTAVRCLDRIHKRGRSYEQRMDEHFLLRFEEEYEKMFSNWTISPLIRVDAAGTDCRDRSSVAALAREVRAYIAVG
jgi:deoxyguanosine kinase